MNCGSCHYKLLPGSNHCRQPGLSVEWMNIRSFSECVCIDLGTVFVCMAFVFDLFRNQRHSILLIKLYQGMKKTNVVNSSLSTYVSLVMFRF